MPIPTQQPGESIFSGPTGSPGPSEGITAFGRQSGTILGDGVRELGHGMSRFAVAQQHQENQLAAIKLKQKGQDESLEVAQKYSQLRTDWNQHLQDYQDNPSEDVLTKATTDYDEYVKGLVESGSSKDVKDELALKASAFRIGLINDAHTLQSKTRMANFGATFDKMMANGEDSIFAAKSLAELDNQRQLMNATIGDAVRTGRIRDPETIQLLKSKVDHLALSWGEANLTDRPQLVKDIVNGEEEGYRDVFNGISVKNREVLLNKADSVLATSKEFDRFSLNQALQSDTVQRIKTGEGRSLNLDQYEAAFGKPARQAAELQLSDAVNLHGVNESIKGASTEQLQQVLNAAQPQDSPDSSTYGEQQKYADQVEQMVTQAQADKKHDAFTFFASNPAIKLIADEAERNPSPEKTALLQHAVLEKQKMDKSLSPDDYAIMSKASAEKFIANFNGLTEVGNKADGSGVRELLAQFTTQYGDNIHIALNQLSKVKGGESVTPLLNPLMWHIDNPTIFRLTLDALRKDPKEAYAKFESEKERKNFLTDATLDPNLLNYASSMRSANNGEKVDTLINGAKEAFTAFSRDYVLNGGKLKDASAQFFSNYTWGSVNGAVYARPRLYSDQMGVRHSMSDEQVNLSNGYLEVYPKKIDPSTIDPSTIVNQTRFFSSDELTHDVANALKQNVFWSTTGDSTGVYLFTKGAINGAPKQVKDKQGNPIRVNFIDTMKRVSRLGFGETKGIKESEPMTSDTWVDHFFNALGRASN